MLSHVLCPSWSIAVRVRPARQRHYDDLNLKKSGNGIDTVPIHTRLQRATRKSIATIPSGVIAGTAVTDAGDRSSTIAATILARTPAPPSARPRRHRCATILATTPREK